MGEIANVFISYRRTDTTSGYASWIYDRLADEFGADSVFMDIDSLPLGVDFVDRVEQALAAADIALVLIGPSWLNATDEFGNRRLDDPDDFVRIEVAAALSSGSLVIPVLVDGAQMAKRAQLPEELQPLTRRQALVFQRQGRTAIQQILTAIDRVTRERSARLALEADAHTRLDAEEQARPATETPNQGRHWTYETPASDVVGAEPAHGSETAVREQVAKAMWQKGFGLGELGRSEEAIAVYDDVITRFDGATEPSIRDRVAWALVNKGYNLGVIGRYEEEISTYESVIARFGDPPETAMREQVAKAMWQKGFRLGELGRSEEAIAVYDDVIARFGGVT